jgi:hypothetical protein
LTQIRALDLGHGEKLPPGAAQGNLAAFHDIAAVRDLQGLPGVLLNQKDSLALRFELAQADRVGSLHWVKSIE